MAKTQTQNGNNLPEPRNPKKELRLKIQAVVDELHGIEQGIEAAEKSKAQAKDNYQKSFDQGDEGGMKSALSQIRNCNAEKENLIASLGDFPANIEGLQTAHSELLSRTRIERDTLDKKLTELRAKFQELKIEYDSTHGILSELNELDNLLLKIKDRFSPEPEPAKTESQAD